MSAQTSDAKPEALIIGIDGATFDLIEPWIRQGKLPTFKRLLQSGCHGRLESTKPPVTAPAWTTFMTGKNPGKHGLYNFVEPVPDSYEMRYTNTRSRLASSIWRILGDAGKRVGVINVPMTYPPEPVNGFMISGMDAPENSKKITHPPGLFTELLKVFGKVGRQLIHLGYLKTDSQKDRLLAELEKIDDHYLRMTMYLLDRHPVNAAMVVFTSSDTVQHFFWHDMDKKHPRHDPEKAGKYGDAILEVYRRMDEIISKLTARLSDDAALIVMSDHGFQGTSTKSLRLNTYLEQLGVLRFKQTSQSGHRALFHQAVKLADGILRKTLTPTQKAKVASWFPQLRRKWEAQSTGLSHIDWPKTRAYAYEALALPLGIWINRKETKPEGTVFTDEEYEHLIEYLTRKLCDLKDPLTGAPLIRRVYRKTELYTGPHLDFAPDLIPSWWEGTTFESKPSFAGKKTAQIVEYNGDDEPVGGEWSGTHSLSGLLILEGKPFHQNKTLENANIADIAPTLCYLLGVPVLEDMDGLILLDSCTDEFKAAHAVSTEKEKDGPEVRRNDTYLAEESSQIKQRLRDLGYIE